MRVSRVAGALLRLSCDVPESLRDISEPRTREAFLDPSRELLDRANDLKPGLSTW